MSKIVIIGAGQVGTAVIKLAKQLIDNLDSISIIDRRKPETNKTDYAYFQRDVEREDISELIKDSDCVISLLPWEQHKKVIEACFHNQVPIIGAARPNYYEIDNIEQEAVRHNTLMLNGCGLEPGLSEIILTYLSKLYETIDSVKVYCGGIPETPRPPLGYRLAFDGLKLPFSKRPTYQIINKSLVEVERFSDIEQVHVDGVGVVEAYHDGLLPWMKKFAEHYKIKTYTQKTVRWPGYAAVVNFLHDSGFLDEEVQLNVDGKVTNFYQFVSRKVAPQLKLSANESTLSILMIKLSGATVDGNGNAKSCFSLQCRDDRTLNIKSMAKITALPILFIAKKILEQPNAKKYFKPDLFLNCDDMEQLIQQLVYHGVEIQLTKQEVSADE